MKLLIASDIHGDIEAARAIVEACVYEGGDKLLLLGDILYHGPRNDLPKAYAPKEVIELLNSIKNKIIAVRGNCDSEVDQMVLDFPILSDYALICDGNISLFATHGHVYNKTNLPKLSGIDVLLHGHTHVHTVENIDNKIWYINPGSAALPKEAQVKSYGIYEDSVFLIKSFDGEILLNKSFK